jgi:hypothetical protein
MMKELKLVRKHVFDATPPLLAATRSGGTIRILEKRGALREIDIGSGQERSVSVEGFNAADGVSGIIAWVTNNGFTCLDRQDLGRSFGCPLRRPGVSVALNWSVDRAYATIEEALQIYALELSNGAAKVSEVIDIDTEFTERLDLLRGPDESIVVNCFANPDEQEFMIFEPSSRSWSARVTGEAPIICSAGKVVTFAPPSSTLVVRGRDLAELWRMPCELPDGDWLEPRAATILRGEVLAVAADKSGVRLFSLASGATLEVSKDGRDLRQLPGVIVPVDEESFLRWRIEPGGRKALECWAVAT